MRVPACDKETLMFLITTPVGRQASPLLRDKFLIALDRQDQAAIHAAARDLTGCVNFLPSTTCVLLGLAPGSTYGDAAATIAHSQSAGPEAA
jgi:hypothetical protein